MTGRLFEIREFALQDGPGVRTTAFLKGCPLRCAWCHNPEGQSFEKDTMRGGGGEERPCGEDWTADALAAELLRNADIFAQSGGGVTFSGGEPLAQAAFVAEVADKLRAAGVTCALETSGHVPEADYRAVVSRMDFVYQDLKHHDAEAFRRWCGGDLALVLRNLAWLRGSGVPFAVRVPCVPGVNDASADREAFLRLAGPGTAVEFLPYNPAAPAKYPMLGRAFPLCPTPGTPRRSATTPANASPAAGTPRKRAFRDGPAK
ncbi:MAG: radical SAM protein [Kiritimatiellae bacterium]|nr:radical SAM protein [Kiritimatiellia bacterium]